MIPSEPVMLLSYINLKLRDYFSDLDVLCEELEVSKEEIISKLESIDYHYDKEKNRFV